ncbi:unnamed protein product [Cyprideis torosa]|uniref:Uncharacterized protein n=1 Tax=Cyprideis torosa TaxID=163714 RepID=A0A7R8WCV8_9CRUS|nr:unnamed protein product [Cyprideis torosa]CAG0888768.1 unnamed protein product [Cyprideis torosa]
MGGKFSITAKYRILTLAVPKGSSSSSPSSMNGGSSSNGEERALLKNSQNNLGPASQSHNGEPSSLSPDQSLSSESPVDSHGCGGGPHSLLSSSSTSSVGGPSLPQENGAAHPLEANGFPSKRQEPQGCEADPVTGDEQKPLQNSSSESPDVASDPSSTSVEDRACDPWIAVSVTAADLEGAPRPPSVPGPPDQPVQIDSGTWSKKNRPAVTGAGDSPPVTPTPTSTVYDGKTPEFVSIEGHEQRHPLGSGDRTSSKKTTSSSSSSNRRTKRSPPSENSAHSPPSSSVSPPRIRELQERAYKLWHLHDGLTNSTVFYQLCQNNDQARMLGACYMGYFDLSGVRIDLALRQLLEHLPLIGESQERERILMDFSARYFECNPSFYSTPDAVHTLICALMMLNTDLHSGINRDGRITASSFVSRLKRLNDGRNFNREHLVELFKAIRSEPLQQDMRDLVVAPDVRVSAGGVASGPQNGSLPRVVPDTNVPFLSVPEAEEGREFKRGYLIRKSTRLPEGKQTPWGKRNWRMFFAVFQDLVLFLYPDEKHFQKHYQPSIITRIHHSYASHALDYTKRSFVFRLHTPDQAESLFQATNQRELESWIDTINWVNARYVCRPLAAPCASELRFQRPLFPSTTTKANLSEQFRMLHSHLSDLEESLTEHLDEREARKKVRKNEQIMMQEKENFLRTEIVRFSLYSSVLYQHTPREDCQSTLTSSYHHQRLPPGLSPISGPGGILSPSHSYTSAPSPRIPPAHPHQNNLDSRRSNYVTPNNSMALPPSGTVEDGRLEAMGADLSFNVQDCRVLVVGAGGIGCEVLKNLVMSGFKNITIWVKDDWPKGRLPNWLCMCLLTPLISVALTPPRRTVVAETEQVDVLHFLQYERFMEGVKKSQFITTLRPNFGPEKQIMKSFHDVDLDTIELSNLNRQFLFQRRHVGMSKAEVARETALTFNPDVEIIAKQDNIMKPEYNTAFFNQFVIVMSALDNRAARAHVNRLCLAAKVPLIESGTAGYLGQVQIIQKSRFECYECQEKAPQKTFPGCTIRNTPTEPIHCIIWAKHLFNQLFGAADADQDVSPDLTDPSLAGDEAVQTLLKEQNSQADGNVSRVSTQAWAQSQGFNGEILFRKFFCTDVRYLLTMSNLWKDRRPPQPLEDMESLSTTVPKEGSSTSAEDTSGGIRDQRQWSPKECAEVFVESVQKLKDRYRALPEGDFLVWDKDDDAAMDFVCACANLRAYIFGIAMKSRFDVKSMAGNIIPAIATTNAIIAGLVVTEALKILRGRIEDCRALRLAVTGPSSTKVIYPSQLCPPNPKCFVCTPGQPEIVLQGNLTTATVRAFDKALKQLLNMSAPDAQTSTGNIFLSSEEGETEDNMDKPLSSFGLQDGSQVTCDDFLQEYNVRVTLAHVESLEDGSDFRLVGNLSDLAKQVAEANKTKVKEAEAVAEAEEKRKKENGEVITLDEEVLELEQTGTSSAPSSTTSSKRKLENNGIQEHEENSEEPSPRLSKKPRLSEPEPEVVTL